MVALSKKAGTNLPWATVRDAIDGAILAILIEPTLDSAAWPCAFAGARSVKFRVPVAGPDGGDGPPKPRPDVLVAEAELRPNEIQDFAEQLPEIRKAAGTLDLKMHLRLELDGRGKSPAQEIVAKLNDLLAKISKALLFR